MPAPPFKPTSSSSTTPPISVPLSYTANCSITLSAALAAAVGESEADNPAASNPFRCDFIQPIAAVAEDVHPSRAILASDPRSYAYFILALYRLLRHLIPPTDAVAAAAKQSASDSPPIASLDPAWYDTMQDAATAAMDARIRAVFPAGALQTHACKVSLTATSRSTLPGRPAPFTAHRIVRPLLAVDAADDELQLSAWQRWLIGGRVWQTMAAAALEYLTAEMMELLGNQLRDGTWKRGPVACFHEKVLPTDAELLALWRTIGMPAECPAEFDIAVQSADTNASLSAAADGVASG